MTSNSQQTIAIKSTFSWLKTVLIAVSLWHQLGIEVVRLGVKSLYIKVHWSLGLVGQFIINNLLNICHNFWHILAHTCQYVRPQYLMATKQFQAKQFQTKQNCISILIKKTNFTLCSVKKRQMSSWVSDGPSVIALALYWSSQCTRWATSNSYGS